MPDHQRHPPDTHVGNASREGTPAPTELGPAHPVLTWPWFPERPRRQRPAAGHPRLAPARPPRGRGVQAAGSARGPPPPPRPPGTVVTPVPRPAPPRAHVCAHAGPSAAAAGPGRLGRPGPLVGWEGGPTECRARPGEGGSAEPAGPGPPSAARTWASRRPAPFHPRHQGRGAPQAAGGGQKRGPPWTDSPWAALLQAAGVSQAEEGLNPSSSAGRLGAAGQASGPEEGQREERPRACCSVPTQAVLWTLVFTWQFFPS